MNNFLTIEKQSELDIEKACHQIKLTLDGFKISVMEHTNDIFIFEDSNVVHTIMEKILEFLRKVLESIKQFFINIKIEFEAKIDARKLNKQLSEMKDILAKKKSKALGQRFEYFDIQRYKKFYTEFIDRYTLELIKGLNQEFKSIDEYERWQSTMLQRLSDFNYKLSDDEQWKLSVAVNSAIELTEKEIQNREANAALVQKYGSFTIKALEKRCQGISTSNVNYDEMRLTLLNMKNNLIATVSDKVTKAMRVVAHVIYKYPLETAGALAVLVIAL